MIRRAITGLLALGAIAYQVAGPVGDRPAVDDPPPDYYPARPDGGPDGPPPPPPPVDRLFQAIDLDDDGELSPKEIARAGASIAKLDKDKDGTITEDEARPPRPPGPRRPPPYDPKAYIASLMKHDKDGDGKLTAKELPDRMGRMVEDWDADNDGALDKSEIAALARRPPPPPPPPRRPGDGPRPRPAGPPGGSDPGDR